MATRNRFRMLMLLSATVALVGLPAVWAQDSKTIEKPGSARTPAEQQAAGSGTITGKLKNVFVRKYPAVVYIQGPRTSRPDPKKRPAPKQGKKPASRKQVPGKQDPGKIRKNPVMDQKNLIFTPRVLPILVGSTVDFPNSDKVRHSVYTTKSSCCKFNLGTYPSGQTKQVKCNKPGVITLLCNVHAEMVGYIVVCPTPHFAVTNRKGEFTITGVPPGKHKLTFWHEKLAPKTLDVTVTTGKGAHVEFKRLKRK